MIRCINEHIPCSLMRTISGRPFRKTTTFARAIRVVISTNAVLDPFREVGMREAARDVARKVAATEKYKEGSSGIDFAKRGNLANDKFRDRVYAPPARISYLVPHVLAAGYQESDIDEILQESWSAAWSEGAVRKYEDKLNLPLLINHKDQDCPVELTLAKNQNESDERRLFFSYVGYTRIDEPGGANPGRAMERFAYIPWTDFLPELAQAALDEQWDFGHPNEYGYRYDILKSYINYTFFRLEQQDKICIAQDGSFAAFNSGLVDAWYDDIFVCFEPQYGMSEWRYMGLASLGNRGLKKKLIASFNPLPERAEWFTSIDEILYDTKRDLDSDFEHIFLDNLDRLPIEWVIETIGKNALGKMGIEAPQQEVVYDDDFYDDLTDFIESDFRALSRLRTSVNEAIDLALKRISWNYKAAIPSYYPKNDSMSFLLPLCLLHPDRADAALVVELQESGTYQGMTILTMEMAYKDARLICRPDSDWLNTAVI